MDTRIRWISGRGGASIGTADAGRPVGLGKQPIRGEGGGWLWHTQNSRSLDACSGSGKGSQEFLFRCLAWGPTFEAQTAARG